MIKIIIDKHKPSEVRLNLMIIRKPIFFFFSPIQVYNYNTQIKNVIKLELLSSVIKMFLNHLIRSIPPIYIIIIYMYIYLSLRGCYTFKQQTNFSFFKCFYCSENMVPLHFWAALFVMIYYAYFLLFHILFH